MKKDQPMWRHRIGALMTLALVACGKPSSPPATDPTAGPIADLKQIRDMGVLRVATRNAPTTWYIDRTDQPAGLEYDRIRALATALGLDLEIVEAASTQAVLALVRRGEAHLAAAGITITPARQTSLQFSSPTLQVTEQLICNREGLRVTDRTELAGMTLTVAEATSYADTLNTLRDTAPGLTVRTVDTTTEALLRKVWQGALDCTVADSHVFALNRRYFPTLVAEFDLTETRALAWAVHPDASELLQAVNRWLDQPATQALLAETRSRYFAPAERFDFVDLRAFTRRIEHRYPKYDQYFMAAAQDHDIDPLLLAAQGYQESHWDPEATSPTGVRGIMMLTRPTARSVGVTDRLDPVQSIEGGSAYLAKMKTRFSDEVTEPDRTYLALAAYNIGRAHLHDAQKLARELGKSPHHWDDMKTVLPLLSDKSVYPKLKYGYARGHEPVRYVERIRSYQDILAAHAPTES